MNPLFFRAIDRLLNAMLFLAMAVMVVVIAANIFCRSLLDYSLSWGEEVPLLAMSWLTFLGAAVATRAKTHYAFDYLVQNLPTSMKRSMLLLGHIIVIAATLALCYWGVQVAWMMRHWKTASLEISQAWGYAACPTGCLFILPYAIRNALHDFRPKAASDEQEEETE